MRLFALTVCLLASGALADELKGTLKERLDAGGYSYLRIATPKGEVWAAVQQATLEVGKEVSVEVQTEMRNFESKTLKRTWASLIFGTVAGAPAAAPAPSTPGVNPHEQGLPKTSPSTPTLEGKVLETLNAGTYTYLRLETKHGETWAATPTNTVSKGATVRVKNPQPMDGFRSPSLNRTFERIVFGTLEQ